MQGSVYERDEMKIGRPNFIFYIGNPDKSPEFGSNEKVIIAFAVQLFETCILITLSWIK